MAEWTLIASFLSTICACIAAFVALWALARTIAQQIPTVEFLVGNDGSGRNVYKISVSNPTHRLIVLDRIEVLSPDPERVLIQPMERAEKGSLERNWENASIPSRQTKAVFLGIPSGETEYLEVLFVDLEEFGVDFRLQWSKNSLPILERHLIAQRIELDAAEVNSRILAATAGASNTKHLGNR